MHFRPDSVVGCPGILNAARAGNVTIANAVGNGVADDKLTYTYVPALIEYYLGEEPLLPNVDDATGSTTPTSARHCLDRLDQLVVKPVDGSGGAGIVIGPQATDEELAAVRREVLAEPPRLDRAGAGAAVHLAVAGRTIGWRPGTSTCGRSPSTTAERCGCCPAG